MYPSRPLATRRSRLAAAVAAALVVVAPHASADATLEQVDTPENETEETQVPADDLFWLDLTGGYQNFNLQTLEDSGDRPTLIASRVDGPVADVGVGLRISTMTIGVRGGVGDLQGPTSQGTTQEFLLWSLDADLGFRIPTGRLEPHFNLGGGYSTFGGAREAVSGLEQGIDVSGANVRLGFGLDYFVSPSVSLGAQARGELLFLNRRGVPIRDLATPQQVATIGEAEARALEASGSSIGIGFSVLAGPKFHF